MLRKLGKHTHDALAGKDGKISLRRVLAVFFSLGFMHMVLFHTFKGRTIQEALIWAFVSLIVGLTGITTGQNIAESFNSKKRKDENEHPEP